MKTRWAASDILLLSKKSNINSRRESGLERSFGDSLSSLSIIRAKNLYAASSCTMRNVITEGSGSRLPGMRRKGPVPKITKEQLESVTEDGLTVPEIASLYNVSRSSVRSAYKRYGIDPNKAHSGVPSRVDASRLAALRGMGMPVSQIARELGNGKSAIYAAIKANGLPRQELAWQRERQGKEIQSTLRATSTPYKNPGIRMPDSAQDSSFATNTRNAREQPYPTEPLRLLRKDIITSQKPRAPPALSEQEIMLLGFMRKQILAARKAYEEPDGTMRVAGALLSVYKTQMELAELYRRKLQLGSMERYREDASELMNMLRPMIASMNSAKKNGIDPSSIGINLELGTYLARGGYFARIDSIEREMSEG